MKAGVPITVQLDQAEALGVGLSLLAVAKQGKMPAETCATYRRVGEQLVAAAKAVTP